MTRGTVTGDLGIPEQQRYIERIEELEAYQQQLAQRGQPEPIEATTPPEFKSPIKDQMEIREGGFAHFEARLEPIGDPKLTVHWFKGKNTPEFRRNFKHSHRSLVFQMVNRWKPARG
jgi:titin